MPKHSRARRERMREAKRRARAAESEAARGARLASNAARIATRRAAGTPAQRAGNRPLPNSLPAVLSSPMSLCGEDGGVAALHLQCPTCRQFSNSHAHLLEHTANDHPTRLDNMSVGRLGNAIIYQSTAKLFHCSECFLTCREFTKLYEHLVTFHCMESGGETGGVGGGREGAKRGRVEEAGVGGEEAGKGGGEETGGEGGEGAGGGEETGVEGGGGDGAGGGGDGAGGGGGEDARGGGGVEEEEDTRVGDEQMREEKEQTRGGDEEMGNAKEETRRDVEMRGGDEEMKGEKEETGVGDEERRRGEEDMREGDVEMRERKETRGGEGETKLGHEGRTEREQLVPGLPSLRQKQAWRHRRAGCEGEGGRTEERGVVEEKKAGSGLLHFTGKAFRCMCGWSGRLKHVAAGHLTKKHDIPKTYALQAVREQVTTAPPGGQRRQSSSALLREEMEITAKVICFKANRFECLICGWKTKLKGFAINHVNSLHQVERSYACSLCPRSFFLPSHLQCHMASQHPAGRYACPFCCFRSDCLSGFRRHCNRCNARDERGVQEVEEAGGEVEEVEEEVEVVEESHDRAEGWGEENGEVKTLK